MFDQIKQLGALMKNMGEIRQRAEQFKAELEKRTVEGEAGAGAVRVTMRGDGRVVRVQFDAPLLQGLAGDDKVMVEELTAAAFNNARDKVQALMQEEMKKATGGLDLPGLSNMFQ